MRELCMDVTCKITPAWQFCKTGRLMLHAMRVVQYHYKSLGYNRIACE